MTVSLVHLFISYQLAARYRQLPIRRQISSAYLAAVTIDVSLRVLVAMMCLIDTGKNERDEAAGRWMEIYLISSPSLSLSPAFPPRCLTTVALSSLWLWAQQQHMHRIWCDVIVTLCGCVAPD